MATVIIDGLKINYEEAGHGTGLVFMPGGRSPLDLVRPITEPLSRHYRCVIYDRRNCGASDIRIAGEDSEQEIWADELAELIRQLNLAPVYLGGWSAGCRVAILTAIRHPELVKGLLLGWVTGGGFAAKSLAQQYYGQFIEAAQKGGMPAVTETEFFAERIKMNPGNRERLLNMEPREFIAIMQRWSDYFTSGADLPVIGATEDELRRIKAPTCILAGDDDVHPTTAAQNLHRLLPDSELHDPLILRPEWDTLPQGPQRDRVRAERALPIFEAFMARIEAREPARP
jgi:pimeloyl-ACP methyl ester carboxylesterase